MLPLLQHKIDELKEKEKQNKEEARLTINKADQIKKKQILAKVPEAKVWIESNLLDLIAKEHIKIEQINEVRTGWPGDKFAPRELQLSHYDMIPNHIPIESVVEAIKDFEGLSVRSSYQEEIRDIDGPYYPASWNYYVMW